MAWSAEIYYYLLTSKLPPVELKKKKQPVYNFECGMYKINKLIIIQLFFFSKNWKGVFWTMPWKYLERIQYSHYDAAMELIIISKECKAGCRSGHWSCLIASWSQVWSCIKVVLHFLFIVQNQAHCSYTSIFVTSKSTTQTHIQQWPCNARYVTSVAFAGGENKIINCDWDVSSGVTYLLWTL